MKNKNRRRQQRFSFIAREQRHQAADQNKVPKSRVAAVETVRDLVSDHALIRWLERVHEIDLEYARATLRDQVRPISEAGVRVHRDGTHVYVFAADGVLVTVLHQHGDAR